MGDLAEQTSLEGADGHYRGDVSADWEIWGPAGGYIAAIALRAALAEVDPALTPASMSCQFLAVAEFAPVEAEVVVRRATRRTALVAVRLYQGDRDVLDAQVWCSQRGDALTHRWEQMPDLPPPHELRSREELFAEVESPPPPMAFWDNLDSRQDGWIPPEEWATRDPDTPEWTTWMRFRPRPTYDDEVLEALRLVVLADLPSWPAATRAHTGDLPWVAPSLDLHVQFHSLSGLGEWLLVRGLAPVADDGLLGFTSTVWTADGRLAASGGGQCALRPLPVAP